MSDVRKFSDEELTTYLDGEASEELTTLIEAHKDQELLERLKELETGKTELLDMFSGVEQFAPLGPIPANSNKHPALPFALGAMSGLAAAALVGAAVLFAGIWSNEKGVEPWHKEVAAYHALYVPATLAQASTPDVATEKLKSLSKVIRRDLTKLPTVEGMNYRRAQNLGFEGQDLIQIAFLADGDVPMALCILKRSGSTKSLESTEISGLKAVHWADETHRFLLIGGHNLPFVENAAKAYFKSL